MSRRDWPSNWPPLNALLDILAEHPKGCTRRDFDHLDETRASDCIKIAGPGWINIQRRLIADGHAEKKEGQLFAVNGCVPAHEPARLVPKWSAPEIRLAMADCGLEPLACAAVIDRLMGITPASEPTPTDESDDIPTD